MSGPYTRRSIVRQKKQRGRSVHFPAGTQVFHPECPSRQVYRLNSGRVQLSIGPRAVVELLTPGCFFGEKCFMPACQSRQQELWVEREGLKKFLQSSASESPTSGQKG
jgi:cyclic nucleotide-binding protein